MSGILIHLPSAHRTEPATTRRLGPGETARFGRGTKAHPVELLLPDPAVSRLAGEILVAQDHWQLTNYSTTHSYLVENPEGAGEYLRVPPRRAGAPIPFEFARVVLPTRGSTVSFQVFAPDHVYLDADDFGGRGTRTLNAYSLDETATYFLVLVALCEPRLRDESAVSVPTTPQVVERISTHPALTRLTARAVNAHIDYLAEQKLRVRGPQDVGAAGSGARRTGKREAVVGVALRFGLVREEHLALLPSRTPGAPSPEPARPGGHR
ncbi:serine/threonine protein kinase [Streptomyces apricus]|uniref:Serine/threonine protein kinase n=1 Tax=Streptomyces apricus TaxID=1828112 RepID=A0A5B0AL17_9ACTN|nr:serine/threonine protein kinase [Streptomyces apricus]KAA0929771.1 serine/threonine protein kinase [Streptomyces apricus]